MDLISILDRFQGRNFILYGGDDSIVDMVSKKGTILYWFTTQYDQASTPVKQLYSRIGDIIIDVVYIFVTHGYAGGIHIESLVSKILSSPVNTQKIAILEGYKEYIPISDQMTEIYATGTIVAPMDDRVRLLKEVALSMNREVSIPIPFSMEMMQEGSPLSNLLPFIHLGSQSTITYSDQMPTDVMDIYDQGKQQVYDPTQYTSAINWGQRKLLVSEIELLSEVIRYDLQNGGNGQDFLIVYVGSAPGSHLVHLLNLFSSMYSIQMHLWDRPGRFDIKESSGVRIVPDEFADPGMTGDTEGFFTDYVAQRYVDIYGQDNRIIFISDIRDAASEESVIRDMDMQRSWVQKIQPYASQLKFKLPFEDTNPYSYLYGQLYTQAWSRNQSTETRLLSFRPFREVTYMPSDYDRYMSYFNNVTRVSSYDMGYILGLENLGRYLSVPEVGLCTCHDCAREVQVINKYLSLIGAPPSIDTVRSLVTLNTVASRPLGAITNTRTLWTRVSVKVAPSDRSSLIMYKDGISLDKVHIASIGDIFMYADGLSEQEVDAIMERKQPGIPYIHSDDTPIMIMRNVLKGARYPLVINFHTDLIPKYDPVKDRGLTGRRYLDIFLRTVSIAGQDPQLTHMDIWGQLLLFIISRK